MNFEASSLALFVFGVVVAATLGLSFYLGRRATSAQGYFAAHGRIPWFVNGVAFAGDYLSAASFLGICGMIAFDGYDGFLYSIGFLAGWIVALLIIAEPMKRLGKFTFADALNSRFQSRGIKLAAGVSTLVISLFYLIPQMVGAGVLVRPLLGIPNWIGVVLVGTIVMVIVVTAGMVSTTWVQFLKGSLLVLFSALLTVMILNRGLTEADGGIDGHTLRSVGPIDPTLLENHEWLRANLPGTRIVPADSAWQDAPFVRTEDETTGHRTVWRVQQNSNGYIELLEAQTVTVLADGSQLINGLPKGDGEGEALLHPVGHVSQLANGRQSTGPLGPLEFLREIDASELVIWDNRVIMEDGAKTTVFYPTRTPGSQVLMPGESGKFRGIRGDNLFDKLNFVSLMLALFCGTASLPHILIRYYTVKNESAARKSTIVGITTIGLFYVFTLYIGLGAMVSGALDPTDSNMAAPLLAKSLSEPLFAIISAIAFTTVLGTVSGLILASAGAITRDLVTELGHFQLTEHQEVRLAKMASIVVGVLAILLGILFEGMNVGYLVGWAFSIAASANLPALVMCLFWRRVTRQGVIAAILVGMASSLAWILMSTDAMSIYGLPPSSALVPFSEPGIVTIPLGFAVIVVVSLLTQPRENCQVSAA